MEKFCRNYEVLAEATGVSRFELKAIHRVTKGRPECPFIGRSGAYPSDIHKFKRDHPEFKPSLVWPRKSKRSPRGKSQGQPVGVSGISHGRPGSNGQHTPSPGRLIRLAELVS